MSTIIHLGTVEASASGHGGLGVVRLAPSYDASLPTLVPLGGTLPATNLPEQGALYVRDKAQLINGEPNSIAPLACHTLSQVNFGQHISVDSLNPDALDVVMTSDQRWVAGHGSYVVTGPDPHGNYVSSWSSAVGSGPPLLFAVQAGEAAANPGTGILVDESSQYWSRIGRLTLPVVVDDQNPGLIVPGPNPVKTLTALMVVTPYETDWYFGDLLAFYDPSQYDPQAAKLACVRMEGDELQLWVRGQRYTDRVVNPWARSIDIGQQLDGRRPVIVGWSIDASVTSDTTQTGKGSLVVIDPFASLAIDYTFWNRSSDPVLGPYLLLGKIGAASSVSNPFNAAVIDWLMRLDLYEFNLWQEALDLDDLLHEATKLDSVYGIVQ